MYRTMNAPSINSKPGFNGPTKAKEESPKRLPGLFSIEFEASGELLVVIGSGLWSPTIIDAHFTRLASVLASIRARLKPVRVLVDLTSASSHPPELLKQIGSSAARTYAPSDRVAVVLSSSLEKLLMRKAHDAPNYGVFQSMNAARLWVLAYA